MSSGCGATSTAFGGRPRPRRATLGDAFAVLVRRDARGMADVGWLLESKQDQMSVDKVDACLWNASDLRATMSERKQNPATTVVQTPL